MIDWVRFFLLGPAAGFTVYVVMQIVVAWKLVGVWRIVALLPVPIMIWVVLSAIRAYQADSNMWPIVLIFGGPMAAVYLGLVLLCGLSRARRH